MLRHLYVLFIIDDTPSTATPTPEEPAMESMMMYIIYGAGSGVVIILIIVTIIIIGFCCYRYHKKSQGKSYSVKKPGDRTQQPDPESGDDLEKERYQHTHNPEFLE